MICLESTGRQETVIQQSRPEAHQGNRYERSIDGVCAFTLRWSSHTIASIWIGESCKAKTARQHHIDAIALGVRVAHDVHRKINRAHDAVAKFFVDQLFDSRAVNTDDFVPAVNRRANLRPYVLYIQ